MIGSNTADAEDDAEPSNEAEDWSCWVTVAGVSVVGVSGVVLVASVTSVRSNKRRYVKGDNSELKKVFLILNGAETADTLELSILT